MRRIMLFSVSFIMTINFTACKNIIIGRNEINELEFIRALAIDTSASTPGNIRLTLASQRVKTAGGKATEEKESSKVSSEGRTMFEASRNVSTFLDKRPFWGHLEYVVIGEEAAKEGINKYLDLLSRDHEIRMNINVFVMKGGRAEELMEKSDIDNRFVFDRLKGLLESVEGQSVSSPVNLIETMYIQDAKYLSLYLPCIRIISASDSGDEKSINIKMEGFALFDQDRLAGYLDGDMGRGLNWLRDKIKSTIIVVKTLGGSDVSLEVIKSRTRFYPKIKDGSLSLVVELKVDSNIGEVASTEDIFYSETFDYLEKEQSKIIKQEIERVIEFAQREIGLDFFETGRNFYRKYPIKWGDLYEKNWRTEFPKVKFDVVVESKIRRTYDIREPNGVQGGGRK